MFSARFEAYLGRCGGLYGLETLHFEPFRDQKRVKTVRHLWFADDAMLALFARAQHAQEGGLAVLCL